MWEPCCHGDSCKKWKELHNCLKVLKESQLLLLPRKLLVFRLGGQGNINGFAVTSPCVERSEVTRHYLISTIVHVVPQYPIVASRKKSSVLCRVLEHSPSLSKSWLRRDKSLDKGSRRCCVWYSFSVDCRWLMGSLALAAHSEWVAPLYIHPFCGCSVGWGLGGCCAYSEVDVLG